MNLTIKDSSTYLRLQERKEVFHNMGRKDLKEV